MYRKLIIIILAGIFMCMGHCKKRSQISIDGSSTVYPITEAVSEEYRKVDSKVHVTVGVSGTGGGFNKFCTGETHITNASREIKPSELTKCKNNRIKFLEIPVAFDGISFIVSKKNNFVKQLSVEDLKMIFTENNPAKKWNEVNPSFPDTVIKVFTPGQSSGTYDYFVETTLGKHEKVRSDATFSEDDNVLVTGIVGDKNAIGFLGLAYYQENKDSLNIVRIVNPETNLAVEPTLETVKEASYAPFSRPLFVYVSLKKDKDLISKYMIFYLKNAATLSLDVGYIPLPDSEYVKYLSNF